MITDNELATVEAAATGDEFLRLEALNSFDVLDTPPERAFDDLAMLAATVCDAPLAMITFVDGERQWAKAMSGDTVRELPRSMSLCALAIEQPRELMEITDAEQDERFAHHAMMGGPYGYRSYAAVPLVTADGWALGTLCVYDRRARQLSDEQRRHLRALASQVMDQLERRRWSWLVELNHLDDDGVHVGSARALERRLAQEWQRHARRGESLGLLLIDLRVEGGTVIPVADAASASRVWPQEALTAIAGALRCSDYLGRPDADMLAALLPTSGVNASMVVAQRVRQSLDRVFEHHPAWYLRIGVAAMVPNRSGSPMQLLDRARHACVGGGAHGRIGTFSGW